jgi:hypothetical protein
MLDAALSYAAQGYFVFPTHDIASGKCSCGNASCRSAGKHPRTPNGFKDATTNPVKIAQMWHQWPNANVAVDCGRSNLFVADVDAKNGARGVENVTPLVTRSVAFQQTHLVGTPSSGYHYYFSGAIETAGKKLAEGIDLKSHGGYVLVPPSVVPSEYDPATKLPITTSGKPYTVLRSAAILPFPADIPLVGAPDDDDGIDFTDLTEYKGEEREGVPAGGGQHRIAVLQYIWHLRRVQGLSRETCLKLVRAFCNNALKDYNPRDPFSDKELLKMIDGEEAQVALGKLPEATTLEFVTADEIIAERPVPRQRIVEGLLVQGELHVFYGDPGVGKTKAAAYLCAIASRQGRDVGVFINEDLPRDFALCFVRSGGDRKRLFFYTSKDTASFLLPTCSPAVENALRSKDWGLLYFDSINDIKSPDLNKLLASDAARALYGPLSTLAQRYNTAIVCTAHTNKAGLLEGSQQIRAKARIIAKWAKQEVQEQSDEDGISFEGADPDSIISTSEKFQRDKSGMQHKFHFTAEVSCDPDTGEVDIEYDVDGTVLKRMMYFCTSHTKLGYAVEQTKKPQSNVDDLERRVIDYLTANPGATKTAVYTALGGRKSTVWDLVSKHKKEACA